MSQRTISGWLSVCVIVMSGSGPDVSGQATTVAVPEVRTESAPSGGRGGEGRWIPHTLPDTILAWDQQLARRFVPPTDQRLSLASLARWLTAQGIPTVIDRRALRDLGVAEDEPLDISAMPVSLGSALTLVLARHDLAWTLVADGMVISTPDEEGRWQLVVQYDVTAIIEGDYDTLIDLVTASIDTDSWDDVGGDNSIQGFPHSRRDLLVVTATSGTQLKLLRLLHGIDGLTYDRPRPAIASRPLRFSNSSSAGPGSTVVELPATPRRRGLALPGNAGPSFIGGGFGRAMTGSGS